MAERLPQLLTLFCCVTVLTDVACGQVSGSTKPNVVLILTDDQGYGDLGCHGNPNLKTPHLDRLASESVELTQFYVCPNCSPTRACLLTGRYNYRTGVTEVVRGRHMMHADETTIAERLNEDGYRTGIFGKWHLGSNYPMRPTDQGFDEALVHKGGGIGQAAGPPGNTYFDPILEHNNESKKFEGYCDDIFTDAAIEFIQHSRDRPFFVYLASNLPHFPLQISDEYADPYRKLGLHEHNARVYGMIANIDDNVGRLLDKLEDLELEKNTIVIFLSDNGPRTRRTKNDRYPGRYVAGLRGTKTSVYENGIRVPCFIRWPNHLRSGRKVDTIAAHIDLFPTLLDACGVSKPENATIDGRSLMPLLRGDQAVWPGRNVFFQWHSGEVPYKYVHFAVRSPRYKLVAPMDNPHGVTAPPTRDELDRVLSDLELYDIRNDASEINNVADRHPDIVARLLEDYERWFSDVTFDRDFGAAQRIHLGAPQQTTTTLSQFEWRGPGSQSGLGYWQLHVVREGMYRIKLRFESVEKDAQAHLHFGGLHVSQRVKAGKSEYTFAPIRLPEGNGKLEAYVKRGGIPQGAEFVDVQRLD